MNRLAAVLERTLRFVGWTLLTYILTVLVLALVWYLGGFLSGN